MLSYFVRLHIDGGVWDDGGLMALPSVPASNLIVNIVCGRGRIRSSVLPDRFKDARVSWVLTLHLLVTFEYLLNTYLLHSSTTSTTTYTLSLAHYIQTTQMPSTIRPQIHYLKNVKPFFFLFIFLTNLFFVLFFSTSCWRWYWITFQWFLLLACLRMDPWLSGTSI